MQHSQVHIILQLNEIETSFDFEKKYKKTCTTPLMTHVPFYICLLTHLLNPYNPSKYFYFSLILRLF